MHVCEQKVVKSTVNMLGGQEIQFQCTVSLPIFALYQLSLKSKNGNPVWALRMLFEAYLLILVDLHQI